MSRASVVLVASVMLFAAAVVMAVPVSRQRAMTLTETSSSSAEQSAISASAAAAMAAEYNGGEHLYIFAMAIAQLDALLNAQQKALWAPVKSLKFTLDQLHTLFGDLYGPQTTAEAISQGFTAACDASLTSTSAATMVPTNEQVQAFVTSSGRLFDAIAPGKDTQATALIAWLKQGELAAIQQRVAANDPKASTNAYKAIGAVRQQIGEDLITQGKDPHNPAEQAEMTRVAGILDTLHAVFSQGRFLTMAGVNVDHFAPCNAVAYAVGHHAALKKASSGVAADVTTALQMEAMALHFITDHFAAGHVRPPRAIVNSLCGNSLGPLFVKAHHDEDNYFGLHLVNEKNDKWVGFGDTRVADADMGPERAVAIKALQAGLTEILNAGVSKSAALSAFGALAYAPKEDTAAGNHPPLTRVVNGVYQYRTAPSSGDKAVVYQSVTNKAQCLMAPILKSRTDAAIAKGSLDLATGSVAPKPMSQAIVSFHYA